MLKTELVTRLVTQLVTHKMSHYTNQNKSWLPILCDFTKEFNTCYFN